MTQSLTPSHSASRKNFVSMWPRGHLRLSAQEGLAFVKCFSIAKWKPTKRLDFWHERAQLALRQSSS